MAEYQRPTIKALCRGVNLRMPVDAMPEGKYPILQNVRPTFDLEVSTRQGTELVGNGFASAVVHSVAQLDDPTSFATQPLLRLAGNGTSLYKGVVGLYTVIATGFSGNPLVFVPVTPEASPQPWMYIADSGKLVKVRVDGTTYGVGFAPPGAAPTASLQVANVSSISDMEAVGTWAPAGAVAGAIAAVARVNTTIARILYDVGNTGWASVQLTAIDGNTQPGIFLTFAGAETALVQEVKRAIATTTIGSITYDSGVTGLCTIQPAASVAEGDLDGPAAGGGKRSSLREDEDPTPMDRGVRSRVFDLGADCLILLGGAEAVRILSVTTGPDGIQSLRCSTTGTRSAGDALAGLTSIRVYLTGTRAVGNTVTTNHLRNTLTPPAPAPASMAGGIQNAIAANLALIGGRPTQPEDEIHLSVRISNLQQVTQGRIYFDVDAATNDFTRNYYFYEFRPSDLVPAVQQTNTGTTQSVASARTTAYQRNQVDQRTPPTMDDDGQRNVTQPDVGVDNPLAGGAGTTASGAVSGQVGAGASQWSELRFKVRDLTRVGSDTSRTLANVAAIEILITAQATAVLTVDYDALWVGGAYGPDVGTIGVPIVYCYRPRSSVTGNKGNPSPAMRSGVSPRRQAVIVTTTQYANAECDLIDWYRLGGALTRWKFVASTPNGATPTLIDQFPDDVLSSAPGIEIDNYQPWPTTDTPANAVVNVVGTSVTRVSGDLFKTNWAPGTQIQINGIYYSLYATPSSTGFMELTENVGTLTNATLFIAEPLLLGTPLPTWWGDYQGTFFACGDRNNPGVVYWTKGNSPDVTSDVNSLLVTAPSTPLINGLMWDRRPWVLSSSDMFLLERQSVGSVTEFRATLTTCGEGLWSRYAVCAGQKGIYFLAKDGINVTTGGVAVSITDADLYPLFPHEGVDGVAVNGYFPPDMSQTNALQLTSQDGYVYFDYLDTQGQSRTMVYSEEFGGWFPDVYSHGVGSRAATLGPQDHRLLIGSRDNRLIEYSEVRTDVGVPVACVVRTPSDNFGDPRIVKQFGDVMFDANAAAGSGFTVTVGYNLYTNLQTPVTILSNETTRQQGIIDLPSDGIGVLGRDIALNIAWSGGNGIAPRWFQWQPSFLPKAEVSDKRTTDWLDCGYAGAKFVQGFILRANTFGQTRRVQVQGDGGTVMATLDINQNGELERPYSFTPFIAHLVRLIPTDAFDWMVLDVRWVYEVSPEATTVWRTQQTTHDLQGYQHLRDGYLAYMSTEAVTLTIRVDDQEYVYTFPPTGGITGNSYAKAYFPMVAAKGRYFVYALSSNAPFRVFMNDSEIRVKPWGASEGYATVRPFGDISRNSGGARI